MEKIGTVSSVVRYPVKSMAGETLTQAFIGYAGILGDRVYAFTRSDGLTGFPWQTIREHEEMVKYSPAFVAASKVVMPVDLQASLDMAPGVTPIYPTRDDMAVEVRTPGGKTLVLDSAELKAELEAASGKSITLTFSERALTDCRPLSIFGVASAQALGAEIGMPMDPRRFRANIYADWSDGKAYKEFELVGHTLQIGDRVKVAITERDPRCKVITIDPETGAESPKILRHVSAAHEGMAGVFAAVIMEGVIKPGDVIGLA